MNTEKRKQVLSRLARIEGQIRGISKLINADDIDCEKVAQQMSAARKALDKASHTVLACMLEKEMSESDDAVHAGRMVELIAKYA